MSNYGYIRISDGNRQDSSTQLNSIERYAKEQGLFIDEVITEAKSGSKTDISDRELSLLLAKMKEGDQLIITDVSRLGRSRPMQIMGLLDDLAHSKGITIHLTYSDASIDSNTIDDPSIFFQVVGAGFVAQQEAKRRSERATAAHDRRRAEGKASGRKKGSIVGSWLDEHEWLIDSSLSSNNDNASAVARDLAPHIKRDGKELNTMTFRSQLSRWVKRRVILRELALENQISPTLPLVEIVSQLQTKSVKMKD